MHLITVKYDGQCRKCNATLDVGTQAMHERRAGLWCPPCAPTDPEEIRAIRQDAADRKADKYEEWAEKREVKATAALNSYPEVRHDWAFITQPGHIPLRAKMQESDARAYESLNKADRFRAKATSLRTGVRVSGDAERNREERREAVRAWLKKGMQVKSVMWGIGTVTKINKKTVSMTIDRDGVTRTVQEGIHWLTQPPQ